MQPIQLIVAILLGLAALTFVLYPLYRRPSMASATPGAANLSEREQNARQALQEVEFDFQLGNLDEKEYRSLRARYMDRALLEMRNRHRREKELDAAIEEELRRLREAEQKDPESHEVESDGHV